VTDIVLMVSNKPLSPASTPVVEVTKRIVQGKKNGLKVAGIPGVFQVFALTTPRCRTDGSFANAELRVRVLSHLIHFAGDGILPIVNGFLDQVPPVEAKQVLRCPNDDGLVVTGGMEEVGDQGEVRNLSDWKILDRPANRREPGNSLFRFGRLGGGTLEVFLQFLVVQDAWGVLKMGLTVDVNLLWKIQIFHGKKTSDIYLLKSRP